MRQLYEATPKEKKLAAFGRAMMDYSEKASMVGLRDKDIRPYNDLSEVGYMLTQVGLSFSVKDFTPHQQQVIKDFAKYKGSNLKQGGPCTRVTF